MLQYIGAILYLAGSIGVLVITEPYKNTCGALWSYNLVFLIVLYCCAIFNILRRDHWEKASHRAFLGVLILLLVFGYTIIGTMSSTCFDFYREVVPSLIVVFTSSLGSLTFFFIRFLLGRSYV
jgi:hypothetical protein